MVPPFIGHFIAIISRSVKAAVPIRLPGVNAVSALLRRNLIAHIVKKIKFKFRPDYHSVRNPGFFHIRYCTQADIFRILVKRPVPAFPNGAYIAAHGKGGDLCKGIYICSVRIGQKDHITLFHRRIPIIGTVKTNTIGKRIFPKALHRDCNVPPAAVNVRHLKINHANLLFFA